MIITLTKHSGYCFRCPDFHIIHSDAGYEVAFQDIGLRPIPEADAISLVNRYMGAE